MDPHFQNECIVSGTLGFVFRMSQIFGVASVKMTNVRNIWHIRVSRAASLYGKFVILLMCLLTSISITWDILLDASFHYFTPINTVMLIAMASAISSALLTQAFSGMYRMQCLITSLLQIRKINAELSVYGPLKSYEKKKRSWIVCSLIGGFILLIVDYGIFVNHIAFTHENFYIEGLYLSHYMKYAMLKVLTIQICLIFTTVLSSFNHLNDCLNNLLQQMVGKCAYKINTLQYSDPKVLIVQRLGFLYCCLCDVIQNLDRSHGIVLVPIVGSFLLHFIVTPYCFITKMFDTTNFYHAIIQVFWAVYHGSDLMMIVEPCHRTQKQMNLTKQLISQLIRVTPTDHYKLIAELELFYKHTMVNEAEYAPIKLFYLNRALLLTILGSITTYLVVVIKL